MMKLVRLLGIILLSFTSFAFAATEYLPPASTPEELQAQVNEVQALLPFATRNGTGLIQIQQRGIEALRKQFPEFESWAAAKPDPITITIEKREMANELSYVLQRDRFVALQKDVFAEIDGILASFAKRKEAPNSEALRQRILNSIGETLLSGADSLRGLITGVLQVLPAEKKAMIFKAGDPANQLKLLRDLQLTDEILRSGNFQAERFGLSSRTVTVSEILKLIEQKVNIHQEFLKQVGVLAVFTRTTEKDLLDLQGKESQATRDRLLNPADFRFLESGEGAVVAAIEANLNLLFAKSETKIKKALGQTIAAVPKQWFERREIPIEITKPYAKVIEVHPYLGVNRGCIGGDCSTSYSPMYPYSPWEHDYFIQDATGAFVGYISATRVEANGRSALYLKDMSGRALSADMAEVILHAFQKAYPHYGVEQYLVANATFTNSQNHFAVLKQRFAKYNGTAPTTTGAPVTSLKLTFPDAEVRTYIQVTAAFASNAGYDNPAIHLTGAVFAPQIDMSGYKVSYKLGTVSAFKPQTPKDSLIFALRLLSADENAKIKEIPGIVESEVKNVMRYLKNPERADLATYYNRIGEVFNRYGIELSRSFRRDQENFFVEGHVMASDAFSTSDESMRVDSEKFFVTFCRRTKDFLRMGQLAQKWPDQFNASKRVTDLMNLYANRAEDADIMALMIFATEKNKVAQEHLKSEKIQPRVEPMLSKYLLAEGTQAFAATNPALFNMRAAIANHPQLAADVVEREIRNGLSLLGISFDKIPTPDFKRNLELAIVQSQRAFEGELGPRRLNFYFSEFEKGRVDTFQFMVRIIQMRSAKVNVEAANAIIDRRLSALKKAPRDNEKFALESLLWNAVRNNQERQDMHFSPAMLKIVKAWVERTDDRTILPESLAAFFKSLNDYGLQEMYKSLNARLTSIAALLNGKPEGSLANFYEKLNSDLAFLGLNLQIMWSNPELKRKIAKLHIRFPEAFDTKQPEAFGRTMGWATELVFSGEEFERPVGLMIANLKAIGDTPQFRSFVQKIIETSRRQSSPVIYRVLVQLVAAGAVTEETKLETESLQELLKMDDPFVKVFAASRLLKANPYTQLSADDLRTISKMLANGDESKLPDVLLMFSERAMDILLQVRTNDEQVQKEIRETVKEDDNIRMVLKAAIAYVKNGGSVKDMRKYVDEAFADLEANEAKKWAKKNPDVEFKRKPYPAKTQLLRSYFNAVEKDPSVTFDLDGGKEINKGGECQLIFLRAKFLGTKGFGKAS